MPESQVLVVVADHEGDFGGGRVRTSIVTTDGDEVVAVFNHER